MTTDPTRAAEIVVEQLLNALREIVRLRLATEEGSLRVRADRIWETATKAIEASLRPTDAAEAGEVLKGNADSAKGWFRRAFAAEARVLELESGLRKIATGRIKGEPGNHKDALSICQGIANELLATPSPVTDETALSGEAHAELRRDLFIWKAEMERSAQEMRKVPGLGEAADGTDKVARLLGRAHAALASTPQPASAEEDVMIGEFIAQWDEAAAGVMMDADTAQALAREFKRMRDLIYVPGVYRCAKCSFTLIQSTIRAADGAIGSRDEPGEKCPNDGAPLWRTTYRDQLEDAHARWEEQVNRAVAAERELAAIRQSAKGGE